MIIAAEVTLFLIGLYAVITGSFLSGGGRYVLQGGPARVIGVIAMLPMPLSLVVAAAVVALFLAQNKEVTERSFFWVGTAIEGSSLVVCMLAMGVLSRVYRTRVEEAQLPNSRRRFGAPLPTILEAIEGTLHELGVETANWSSDRRRVTARIGVNLWSDGQWLTVDLEESGDVRVSSVCQSSWQMIDFGKNAKNRHKFLETLAGRLESGVVT
ncbi:MAG TPA: hypothetical protein VK395_22855 [Gemmataceae bacterium]|nr:hypothetical protein [Gemmataceae bacterium]